MGQRRHTLLIVDDEPNLLDSLHRLFHRDYRVLLAADGPSALTLLREQEIHVILTDQRMPNMSGDVFLSQAREIAPDAVRILFTGYAEIDAVVAAVNRGQIFRFLLKPWDPGELESVVQQAAEQYDLLADRRRLLAELQKANEHLTLANRELADNLQLKIAFLEVASHEFNTPITLVHGMSELLRLLNPDRDETEREIVQKLAEGARRLARLVADTLKLMSAEDFRLAIRPTPVELAPLLKEVADQVQPFIHARRQRLRLNLSADLGTFEIDANKIRDAVVNLLTNAIKFTPDEGELELGARLDPATSERAEIWVVDCGIGVEPRALDRFFEPFFTEFEPGGHSSGNFGFQKRGLGLGLSLVKKFIELHGGEVAAESSLGRGTRVTIRLPRRTLMDASSTAGSHRIE
ncbi:hypothetical protein BH23PLA1_BH23PLA1_17370 [soil metagenome]